MRRVKRILVPLDYSECADEALDYAVGLAGQMGSRLLVLYVVAPHEPAYFAHVGVTVEPQDVDREEKDRLRKHVAKVLGRRRVAVDCQIAWGDPPQCILSREAESGCDLVVVGNCGRTAWDKLLMGSVAEKVVRYSRCPVLVVRTAETAAASKPKRQRAAAKPVRRRAA